MWPVLQKGPPLLQQVCDLRNGLTDNVRHGALDSLARVRGYTKVPPRAASEISQHVVRRARIRNLDCLVEIAGRSTVVDLVTGKIC